MDNSINKILDKVYSIISNNIIRNEKDYFLFHRYRFYYILKFINEFKYQEKLKFLDIGSGFCHLTIGVSLLGYKSYGVDLMAMNEATKKRCEDFNLEVKDCDLSEGGIPFIDHSFDIILLSEVLEHLNFHPRRIFMEIYRVLKPGGKIIITTPNLLRLNNRIKILIGKSIHPNIKEDYTSATHYREYSIKELIFLLEDSDFKINKVEYVDFDYPNINKVVKMINRIIGLLRPKLKGNIVIIGKK